MMKAIYAIVKMYSQDHLGATQHIIVSACQPAILPPFHTHSRSSPSGKTAGEEVPMEDNPAYADVSIYDNIKEPKGNC